MCHLLSAPCSQAEQEISRLQKKQSFANAGANVANAAENALKNEVQKVPWLIFDALKIGVSWSTLQIAV